MKLFFVRSLLAVLSVSGLYVISTTATPGGAIIAFGHTVLFGVLCVRSFFFEDGMTVKEIELEKKVIQLEKENRQLEQQLSEQASAAYTQRIIG